MTFEKFVATFQKAIDDLEMYWRGMHNGDIVDFLWTKMGNPELAPYVVSMKVYYQVVRRGYKEILQNIVTQIPLLTPTTFRARVLDLHQTDVTTKEGGCPEQGAHTTYRTLFTGTYPYNKWIHDSVSHYHEAIRASRGTTKKKRYISFQKHHQTQKRKAAELCYTIVELTAKKACVMSEISVINNDSSVVVLLGRSTDILPTQAGRKFGCRSEKIESMNK